MTNSRNTTKTKTSIRLYRNDNTLDKWGKQSRENKTKKNKSVESERNTKTNLQGITKIRIQQEQTKHEAQATSYEISYTKRKWAAIDNRRQKRKRKRKMRRKKKKTE